MSKLLYVSRKKYGKNAIQMSYYKIIQLLGWFMAIKKWLSLGSFFGDFIHSLLIHLICYFMKTKPEKYNKLKNVYSFCLKI